MAPGGIWQQMNYAVPRGGCNHRDSFLRRCACLRFMIHPIKAATSFECDGCSHHASFHSMENPGEEEIVRRWLVSEKERQASNEENGSRKRPRRAIEDAAHRNGTIENDDTSGTTAATPKTSRVTRKSTQRKNGRNSQQQAGSSNMSERVIELSDGGDI